MLVYFQNCTHMLQCTLLIMSTHIYELAYLITMELLLFSEDAYSLLSLAVTDESN